MVETAVQPLQANRRPEFAWLLAIFVRPVSTIKSIASLNRALWLVPLLTMSLTAVFSVISEGKLRQAAAAIGEIQYPPYYEYYSPQQQEQFMRAVQATSGTTFLYVIPAITRLASVWVGWLVVGGMIHLVMTVLGGRGDVETTMNIVAWAGFPLALRDIVQGVAMFASGQLIQANGLSGFSPPDMGNWSVFLGSLMASIDIYLLWTILLLVIGVSVASGLSRLKSASGVIPAMLLMISAQAGISLASVTLGGLAVIRPFF